MYLFFHYRRAFVKYTPWSYWLLKNFYYLFCMHILIVSLLVCLALFVIHTYFMLYNTTTWERFSRKNITYLKVINDEKINPFYENYCRNVANFFSCGFTSKSSANDERKWENVYIKYMKSKFSAATSSSRFNNCGPPFGSNSNSASKSSKSKNNNNNSNAETMMNGGGGVVVGSRKKEIFSSEESDTVVDMTDLNRISRVKMNKQSTKTFDDTEQQSKSVEINISEKKNLIDTDD